MNKVRLALVGALVLGLGVGARAGKEDPKPGKGDLQKKLIGKWDVVKGAPPGSKTATMEFTKDGKILMGFEKDGKEVKFDATYKVEGKGFTMSMKRGDMEVTQKVEVAKAEGDTLVLKGEKGDVLELRRKKGKLD